MGYRREGEVPVVGIDGVDLSTISDADRTHAEHLLTFVRMGKVYGKADGDGYRPVHSATGRTVWGRNRFPRIRDGLTKLGIIESNGSYRPGVRSTGFRVADQYRESRFGFEVRHAPDIVSGLRKAKHAVSYSTHRKMLEAYGRLTLAEGWESDLPSDRHDADSQAYLMRAVESGEPMATCDEFGLRLHHAFCWIKSDLRRHVLLDGESLVETDISNCQPLMLAVDLMAWAAAGGQWEGAVAGTDRLAGPYADDPTSGLIGSVDPDTLEVARGGGTVTLPEDARRFVRLCESGNWYEEIQEDLGWSRALAKHRMMLVMFGERRHEHPELAEWIADYFPTVRKYLDDARRLKGDKFLAERLQRAESRIVYAGAVRSLQESGDVPLLTIHDGFYTRVRDARAVREAVTAQFASVGLAPVVKTSGG